MKNFAVNLPLMMTLSAPAFAQTYVAAGPGYQENTSYGYAQVLRVQPAYESYTTTTSQPRCVEEHHSGNTTGATVLGAIVGGALGNQVGKGDGRKAATVAGAVAGGAIGHEIAENHDGSTYECPSGYIQEQQTQRVVGYDVEYTYKGDHYMSRLPYDPGNHLRVRVSVVPDDSGR
jgi:uncharacterized protein YcfJ